jgi:hypothetical protein
MISSGELGGMIREIACEVLAEASTDREARIAAVVRRVLSEEGR